MRIDADAHVIETEETWEYMEGADRKFMPRMVAPSTGELAGRVLARRRAGAHPLRERGPGYAAGIP